MLYETIRRCIILKDDKFVSKAYITLSELFEGEGDVGLRRLCFLESRRYKDCGKTTHLENAVGNSEDAQMLIKLGQDIRKVVFT